MNNPINEWFSHTYLINLDRSKDRLEQATRNCAKVGIAFERYRAIDGDTEEVEFNGEQTPGWNKRAAALCKTTIELIEEAKKKGYESIFIMEDDVCFPRNFLEKINRIRIPNDFELFHFRITPPIRLEWKSPGVIRIFGAWCCQAYAIHSKIYDLMIEELSKFDRPLDAVTMDIHARGFSYATSTNLVDHPTNYSTLRQRVIDYRIES